MGDKMIGYPEWYKIPAVKFKIIKYTYNHETAMIKPNFVQEDFKTIRMLRIHNVQHLDLWLKFMHIWDSQKIYNIYYSLAGYEKGIPYSTLYLSERDFGDWKKNHWKEMVSYDFLLDIDGKNTSEIDFAYYSAKEIKKFFDKFGVPYNLRFSGMGFHFIIPYDYFEELGLSFNPSDENRIYKFYNEIARKLNERFSVMIDTKIYDTRRVCKIPYSLALYNGRACLCRPFESDDDFNSFRLMSMLPLRYVNKVRQMTEKLFNENGNIYKLLKELDMKW